MNHYIEIGVMVALAGAFYLYDRRPYLLWANDDIIILLLFATVFLWPLALAIAFVEWVERSKWG